MNDLAFGNLLAPALLPPAAVTRRRSGRVRDATIVVFVQAG